MTAPSTAPQPNETEAPEQEAELWMLAGLARVIHWCEELLALVNGPVLLFGLGIALVDLLTDGQLTTDIPVLLLAWGVSQALGIDTQLLGCWSHVRHAWEHGHYRQMAGWLILGLVIGYAAWQAGDVFAVQQSQHISEAAALAQLGMSAQTWFGWRAFLAVGLVALAGITRYQKPRKVKVRTDLAYERDELRAQLELEPLRQQLAKVKAAGVGGRVRSALDGVRGPATDDAFVTAFQGISTPSGLARTPAPVVPTTTTASKQSPDRPPNRPPTGPGTPTAAPSEHASADGETDTREASASKHRKPGAKRPGRVRIVAPREPAEQRIRRVWRARPGASVRLIARRASVSESTASKWRALLMQEDASKQTPEHEHASAIAQ